MDSCSAPRPHMGPINIAADKANARPLRIYCGLARRAFRVRVTLLYTAHYLRRALMPQRLLILVTNVFPRVSDTAGNRAVSTRLLG